MKKSILSLVFIIAFSRMVFAQDQATALITRGDYQGSRENGEIEGLWLSHWPSNHTIKIHADQVNTAQLSPDGRKIACTASNGSKLHIINNDGTGSIYTGYACGSRGEKSRQFAWTISGIFWHQDTMIHRYIPETRKYSILPINLKNLGKSPCYPGVNGVNQIGAGFTGNKGMYCSKDGRHMWIHDPYDSGIEGMRCDKSGWKGAGRGVRPYLVFPPDFSSYTLAGWGGDWGHGRCMSNEGLMMFIRLGEHRHYDPIVEFDKDIPPRVLYGKSNGISGRKTGKYPAWDPPIPDGWEVGLEHVPTCVNNDSILGGNGQRSYGKVEHYWFNNWKTKPPRLIGEFARVSPTNKGQIMQAIWWGKLPDPHNLKPFILIDRTNLSFDASAGDPASQKIAVSNASSTTVLKTVEVKVRTPDISWLKTRIEGTGNAQTIVVSIVSANLTSEESEATIRISGGTARNHEDVSITVYRTGAIPAPTNLDAQPAGDSLLDVRLTWTDNSSDESGYYIDRSDNGGSFRQTSHVKANAASCIDEHLSKGAYAYRVRAYKDLGKGKIRESAPSNVASAVIEGIPWIRLAAPSEGEYHAQNTPYHVRWTANLIDEVVIEWRPHQRKAWITVNEKGSIGPQSPQWGEYVWQVPDTTVTGAEVRVVNYLGGIEGKSSRIEIGPSTSPASISCPVTTGMRHYRSKTTQFVTLSGRMLDANALDKDNAPRRRVRTHGCGICIIFDRHGSIILMQIRN